MILLIVSCPLLGGLFCKAAPLAQNYAQGLPFDRAPAAAHLKDGDRDEVLLAARALMADASAHGYYWDATYTPSGVEAPLEPHSDKRRDTARLPAAIRRLKPVEVSVRLKEVTLCWEGYHYGVYLVLLSEDNDAAEIREHNGMYNHSEELAPGIWSRYWFH